MNDPKPFNDIPNYEILQELTENDCYVLYRGLRVNDRIPVLLKTSRRERNTAADAILIEREFETLRALLIEGVPRAYELLRHDERLVLVMEDRGGVPLLKLIAAHT